MSNPKKMVPSREFPVDSHLELKKQSLQPTEQLQRNDPKFISKTQSLSNPIPNKAPISREEPILNTTPFPPTNWNPNSQGNAIFSSPPLAEPLQNLPANPPNNAVRHFTSRTPLPPMQPPSMQQAFMPQGFPTQGLPNSMGGPSMPNHTSSMMNTPRPLRDTSSMNMGFRPNDPPASALNFNIIQIFFVAFLLMGMVFFAFFLGRWSFSSSPAVLSSGENLSKKSSLGLDEKEKSYTIRVTSMPRMPYEVGRLNLKRAIQIKQKLFEAGYQEVEINRNGKDLVIDVGRFTDPHEEVLLLTLKKLKDFKMWDRKAFTNLYATKIDG